MQSLGEELSEVLSQMNCTEDKSGVDRSLRECEYNSTLTIVQFCRNVTQL